VRFTPDFFTRAPRFLSVAAIATLAGILACAVAGSALGWLAGVPLATMVLATAPGGIAEMTLTAKSLRLGVPVVTVFQVSRMVAMVFLAEPLFRLFGRLGGSPTR
jgi:membrane AbrB-like protein